MFGFICPRCGEEREYYLSHYLHPGGFRAELSVAGSRCHCALAPAEEIPLRNKAEQDYLDSRVKHFEEN